MGSIALSLRCTRPSAEAVRCVGHVLATTTGYDGVWEWLEGRAMLRNMPSEQLVKSCVCACMYIYVSVNMRMFTRYECECMFKKDLWLLSRTSGEQAHTG